MKTILYTALSLALLTSCGDASSSKANEAADKAASQAKETVAEAKDIVTSGGKSIADGENRQYIEVGAKQVAVSNLESKSDSKAKGTVVFTEINGAVKMEARMTGLTQGMHAIHIHAEGDCSSADGKSAGGHWNPTGEEHGKWGVKPFHRGDIGNFEADKNGNGAIGLKTDLWCLGCDDETKNILGKSIIVHAGEDDCKSQPSGAAGARVACGAIMLESK